MTGLVNDKMGNDCGLQSCEGIEQRLGCGVLADNADEQTARAERGDIACDIAGAPDFEFASRDRSTGVGASGEMRVTSP